jgi:hypothetical protein
MELSSTHGSAMLWIAQVSPFCGAIVPKALRLMQLKEPSKSFACAKIDEPHPKEELDTRTPTC